MQQLLEYNCVVYGVLHMACLEQLDMVASGHAVHSYTHKQRSVTLALPIVTCTARSACCNQSKRKKGV